MSVIIRPGQLLRRIQVRDPQGKDVPVQAFVPPPPPPAAPPPVDSSKILCELMAAVQESVEELEDRDRKSVV